MSRSTSGRRHSSASTSSSAASASTVERSVSERSSIASLAARTDSLAGCRSTTEIGPATSTTPVSSTRQIPTCAPGGPHQATDRSGTAMQRQLLARPAWLRDLQQGRPPSPHVADAHIVLRRPERRDVLPERRRRRVRKQWLVEVDCPPGEVLGRVGVHRLVDTAVHLAIRLVIAVEIQLGERQALRSDRYFGDRRHDLRPWRSEGSGTGHVDPNDDDLHPEHRSRQVSWSGRCVESAFGACCFRRGAPLLRSAAPP